MKAVRDVEGLLSRSQQAFATDTACAQEEWKLPDQLRADWEAATTRLQQTQDAITPAETAQTREQQTVLTAYQLDPPLHRMTRDFVVPRLRNLSTASAGQTDGDA